METIINGWAVKQATNGWQIWYWQSGHWHRQGYGDYIEPSREQAVRQCVAYAQD